MNSYRKLTAGLISAWFLFALIGSALNLFRNDQQRIGLAVALAAFIPLLVFLIWVVASRPFRQFLLSLNPRVLTAVQVWRVIGVIFVVLEARGALPGVFALPAGYGDIFIGATAGLVAFTLATPAHRASFILWQILGMADLVIAVALGTTAVFLQPGSSMTLMTILPLSLVPTFLVPLFLILHTICIAQARKWSSLESASAKQSNSPGALQASR
jgi:hypothetical protein